MSQHQPYWATPAIQPQRPPAKAPRLLAYLTIGGLVAVCGVQVITSALDIAGGGIEIDAVRNPGDEEATDRLLAFALIMGVAALAAALSFLYTAVVFICWLFRARKNVEAFGVTYLERGPGWTIGSWFIPFGNLFIPRQVVCEIAEASVHDKAVDAYPQTIRHRRMLVNLWWAAFIVMNILDRIDMFRAKAALSEEPTADQLVSEQSTTVALDVLGIVTTIAAAALAATVVLRVTRDQEERAEVVARQAMEAAVPPPYGL